MISALGFILREVDFVMKLYVSTILNYDWHESDLRHDLSLCQIHIPDT